MKADERMDMIWEAALAMAPAFRDKFDFSDGNPPGEKTQYQRLADMAFASAEALVSEYEFRKALIRDAKMRMEEAREANLIAEGIVPNAKGGTK